MTPAAAATELKKRLARRKAGVLDIVAALRHFALITYAVPVERLTPHIPTDRFEIPTYELSGKRLALLSVVPFIDDRFRFRLLPFLRFHFAQTNYRVYVIDRATGQHVVWFFGTTLGSWQVRVARVLWKVPWYLARYDWKCDYAATQRYETFHYRVHSDWAEARIDLRDTGIPAGLLPGFESQEAQTLILTHPVAGYYRRLDGALGTFSVTHELLEMTSAEPIDLYFALLERLGVLTESEMQNPHSILICPETTFQIHMPPRRLP